MTFVPSLLRSTSRSGPHAITLGHPMLDLQATVSTQVCARRIELPRQAATPDTTDRIRRARERFADRCEHLCIEDLPPVARTAAESWRQESCDDTDPE